MKRTLAAILLPILLPLFTFAAPRTLRIDYYHAGNSKEQWFSLDRTVLEPLDWQEIQRRRSTKAALAITCSRSASSKAESCWTRAHSIPLFPDGARPHQPCT